MLNSCPFQLSVATQWKNVHLYQYDAIWKKIVYSYWMVGNKLDALYIFFL